MNNPLNKIEPRRKGTLPSRAYLHPLRTHFEHHRNTAEASPRIVPPRPHGVWILIILQGEVHIEENAADWLLNKGTIFVGRPGETTVVTSDRGRRSDWAILDFENQLTCDYIHQLQRLYGRSMHCPTDLAFRRLTTKMLNPDVAPSSTVIFDWVSALHEAARLRSFSLGQLLAAGETALADIAEQAGFSLKSVANEVGCASSYLCQRWKQQGHAPLVPLLRTLRLDMAKRLLSSSDSNMGTIAEHCGFSSTPAFCASFKRETGRTPGMWRSEAPNYAKMDGKPKALKQRQPFRDELRMEELSGHDERPVCIWNGPFFQFDGGEVDFPYDTPYDLSLNTITTSLMWVCTLEGHAVLEVAGHSIEVGPGSALLLPKPLNARWSTPTGAPWRRVWLQMRDTWSFRAIEEIVERYGWAFQIPLDTEPVLLAREWVQRWNAGRGIPSVARSRSAYAWLLSWERLLTSGQADLVHVPDLWKHRSKSFHRKIGTISDYAKSVGYSRAYLSRRLRKQWQGGTPAQIVRRQRLSQAAHELREERDSVQSIGQRALYANTSAFIAAFKKEFGVTPLAYRHKDPD